MNKYTDYTAMPFHVMRSSGRGDLLLIATACLGASAMLLLKLVW